ncbi:trimethoprim-resistant dihydrofolate reductase DfrA39 [Pseudomonas aeruginosa]|uniref:Dihydrofolate reductase n=1 Tax=Pseudomonas aeruginosa TaxID=287 RepID=A0A6M3GZS6_PSEAI|nr:trimethoprim-resistant dihydrofolate reductase DfrA39 [Pseudomonas aeruginosa]EMB2825362.1 trimethoprim-resistant dihydrofolate reductase DfrA39 [Pseudomonas aeruginosa]EMB2825643.1 trimethoprim-resistant dihydrofolate reductase DfrA39 [Pseudomonas aeruginosa]QIM14580.1 DfrA39 [Pseudomonas aeruginosa]TYT37355.1 dihydrofolate reductase [Pseudomonas aeruginosa]
MNTPMIYISLIAAMGANRVIGNGPNIPWKIPGEQIIFRKITEGKVLVMGRKTFESIGKPLPNRKTLVISRNQHYKCQDCTVVKNLDEAIAIAKEFGNELFVAGGAEIYSLAMPVAHRIYLTEISKNFEGDVFFPEFNSADFRKISSEEVPASIPYTHSVYERKCG